MRLELKPDLPGDRLYITCLLRDYKPNELLDSLEKGFRAEVVFNLRIYRVSKGLFSFLGDRLVEEVHPTFEAGWNVFEKKYYIRSTDGTMQVFEEKGPFLSELFSLKKYTVELKTDSPGKYYILGSVQVNPVKLTTPLTILGYFMPSNRDVTPWQRLDFSIPRRRDP